MPYEAAQIARFKAKTQPAENGCWLWTRALDAHGYGQLTVAKEHWKAHRFSWTVHNGPIPDGLNVCHRCDTPRCVNPDHLFLGTTRDNLQDKIRKGRCGPTGARGAKNGAVKVKDIPRDQILALYRDGIGVREIGSRFGISKSTAWNIVSGNHWSAKNGL